MNRRSLFKFFAMPSLAVPSIAATTIADHFPHAKPGDTIELCRWPKGFFNCGHRLGTKVLIDGGKWKPMK